MEIVFLTKLSRKCVVLCVCVQVLYFNLLTEAREARVYRLNQQIYHIYLLDQVESW